MKPDLKVLLGALLLLAVMSGFDQPAGTKLWDFHTGQPIQSSPAIGPDGTVYFGSDNGILYAFGPEGSGRWEFPARDALVASPAVAADGTIYFASMDGVLYALLPDGREKWRFRADGKVISSPAIGPDGAIYFGSLQGTVFAINPDGSKRWEFPATGGVISSPAVDRNGTVYVAGLEGVLHAIDPAGKKKWDFKAADRVNSSPAIGADGSIYFGSFDGHIYALKPDGTKKWTFATGGAVRSSPVIGPDGAIYVGSDDRRLYALAPDGFKLWTFTTGGWVRSTPAVAADGVIYFGSYDNSLYAVGRDGQKKWDYPTDGAISSSPAVGHAGAVYFGSWNKRFYAIKGQSPLASGAWSKFRGDARQTASVNPEVAPPVFVRRDVEQPVIDYARVKPLPPQVKAPTASEQRALAQVAGEIARRARDESDRRRDTAAVPTPIAPTFPAPLPVSEGWIPAGMATTTPTATAPFTAPAAAPFTAPFTVPFGPETTAPPPIRVTAPVTLEATNPAEISRDQAAAARERAWQARKEFDAQAAALNKAQAETHRQMLAEARSREASLPGPAAAPFRPETAVDPDDRSRSILATELARRETESRARAEAEQRLQAQLLSENQARLEADRHRQAAYAAEAQRAAVARRASDDALRQRIAELKEQEEASRRRTAELESFRGSEVRPVAPPEPVAEAKDGFFSRVGRAWRSLFGGSDPPTVKTTVAGAATAPDPGAVASTPGATPLNVISDSSTLIRSEQISASSPPAALPSPATAAPVAETAPAEWIPAGAVAPSRPTSPPPPPWPAPVVVATQPVAAPVVAPPTRSAAAADAEVARLAAAVTEQTRVNAELRETVQRKEQLDAQRKALAELKAQEQLTRQVIADQERQRKLDTEAERKAAQMAQRQAADEARRARTVTTAPTATVPGSPGIFARLGGWLFGGRPAAPVAVVVPTVPSPPVLATAALPAANVLPPPTVATASPSFFNTTLTAETDPITTALEAARGVATPGLPVLEPARAASPATYTYLPPQVAVAAPTVAAYQPPQTPSFGLDPIAASLEAARFGTTPGAMQLAARSQMPALPAAAVALPVATGSRGFWRSIGDFFVVRKPTPPAPRIALPVVVSPYSQPAVAGLVAPTAGLAGTNFPRVQYSQVPGQNSFFEQRLAADLGMSAPTSVPTVREMQPTRTAGLVEAPLLQLPNPAYRTEDLRPVVTVHSPMEGERIVAPVLTVRGEARDNQRIYQVGVQLNDGPWQAATGTESWVFQAQARPGPNVIRVKSVDPSGNESDVVTRAFFNQAASPLQLSIQGAGTVSPDPTGRLLEVGSTYQFTAQPSGDQVFAGWSGGLTSASPVLTFVMEPNLSLRATFAPRGLHQARGVFTGLLYPTGSLVPSKCGFFQVRVGEGGEFSGYLRHGLEAHALRGQFDRSGVATATVARAGQSALAVALQMDMVTGDRLSGRLVDDGTPVELFAFRQVFDAQVAPSPFAGRYTFVIPSPTNTITGPLGDAFGEVLVDGGGYVQLAGELPDGTPFRAESLVGPSGLWPLHVPLYGGRGMLVGWMTLGKGGTVDVFGEVIWHKPFSPEDHYYPQGFSTRRLLFGSHYAASRGVPAQLQNSAGLLRGGNLDRLLLDRIGFPGGPSAGVPQQFNYHVHPESGIVEGSFLHPLTRQETMFRGALLQNQGWTSGYFLGPSRSGTVYFQATR